jgi:hypothetical protein
LVEHAGRWISNLTVEAEGLPEEYLHATVQPGDIEVWIDSDMVEYAVGNRCVQFEMASFRDEDKLLRSFSTAFAADLRKCREEDL